MSDHVPAAKELSKCSIHILLEAMNRSPGLVSVFSGYISCSHANCFIKAAFIVLL